MVKMKSQAAYNYERIAAAIEFITQNFKSQPDLDSVARHVHVSPSHFQRMFTEWAGTSPKKFLQYISIQHAKQILKEARQATLWDAAHDTGLSSTSRLHDLFITIEGLTPAEYKKGGLGLSIRYDFADTPFGTVIAASTEKGLCYLAFEEEKSVEKLRRQYPNATLRQEADSHQQNALRFFQHDWSNLSEIKLHLKGTPFQLKVWETLLKVPVGKLTTYGAIAERIGQPSASRAVGTAIGSNPIAFLIPCHRVIQSSGVLGGYRWGTTRKTAIIGWENAQVLQN